MGSFLDVIADRSQLGPDYRLATLKLLLKAPIINHGGQNTHGGSRTNGPRQSGASYGIRRPVRVGPNWVDRVVSIGFLWGSGWHTSVSHEQQP